MEITTILYSLALYFIIWLCVYTLTSNLKSKTSSKFPPGPYKFPVIGNLHQIGQNPHQTFAKLSKKYGPLMSIKLGSKEIVIVSNATIAREILQRHDQISCTRSVPAAGYSLDHSKFSVAWLPVSGPWRVIRKVCREQMFTPQKLDASQDLRREKLRELLEYMERCRVRGEAVDIGSAAFITSLNLMSRTLFSSDFGSYDDSNSSQELKEVVWGVMEKVGAPNLSDFFPFLGSMDLQGNVRGTELYFAKMLDIFDGFINERMVIRGESKKSDLLEALLDEHLKNESEFSITVIKHLLLDLFIAGIDTTSNTVEWAMAELLRSPEKIDKARAELKQVIGERISVIQESDIARLPYLQAIVKETFRLHPILPFLLPRKAAEDVDINGYTVRKGTEILTNVWASGRDEDTWIQPEMFMPERFLGSKIDAKGNHFELIPFGAGRIICPSLPLANRMVQLMLASFIHDTDWVLEGEIMPGNLDMQDKFGLSVKKKFPLRAIPIKV